MSFAFAFAPKKAKHVITSHLLTTMERSVGPRKTRSRAVCAGVYHGVEPWKKSSRPVDLGVVAEIEVKREKMTLEFRASRQTSRVDGPPGQTFST